MKKFASDGTVKDFLLWNPASLGYLAGYAAIAVASGKVSGSQGQTFTAGKLGSFTVGADNTVILGPAEMAGYFISDGPPDQSFVRIAEIFHLD